MEDQVIQCPTCGKRYRMKGNPPATFTCKGCQTVMDLSGYRQPEAVPAVPVKPIGPRSGPSAKAGAGAPAGVPHRRAHRRAGSSPRSRGRHAEEAYDDQDGGGGRHHYQSHEKDQNKQILIVAGGLFLVAVVALMFWLSSESTRKAEEAAAKKIADEKVLEQGRENRERLAAQLIVDQAALAAAAAAAPAAVPVVAKVNPLETRPELAEGSMLSLPIPEGKTKYMSGKAPIQTYAWPDFVTAEERNKIEESITAMIEIGGRDGDEGQEYMVSLDVDEQDGHKFRAVPRLISEFKNLLDTLDFADRLTAAKFRSLDRTLRAIDGFQERDFKDLHGLTINSNKRDVEKAAMRWNWWYDLEKYRLRRKPWDQREDLGDADEGDDEEPTGLGALGD